MADPLSNVVILTNEMLVTLLDRAYGGEEPDAILEDLWTRGRAAVEKDEEEL